MPIEFEKQYDQERFLFEVVGPRFQRQGWLGAYDVFSIVRWKANRAISRVASSLVRISGSSLEQTSRELSRDIFKARDDRERFLIVSGKWKLRLPMASAILTVLYPETFTVYDVRACDMLGGFSNLVNRANLESRWQGYVAFMDAVRRSTPPNLSLRDKDRYLWARSRHDGLMQFVARDFSVRAPRTTPNK
jgi:hypothetical protein